MVFAFPECSSNREAILIYLAGLLGFWGGALQGNENSEIILTKEGQFLSGYRVPYHTNMKLEYQLVIDSKNTKQKPQI